MKKAIAFIVFFAGTGLLLLSFSPPKNPAFKMPWKAAGLTEREAAAHLLSRFTFGARPGDIDEVVQEGLENWFTLQLNGQLNDDDLQQRLKEYDALHMSNQQALDAFPRAAKVLKEATSEGVIKKDSIDQSNKASYKAPLQEYMNEKGYRNPRELYRQFACQKILTAAYSNNQLQQVLTDFWFNHFNVSITKNDCAQFIPAYERDVIRPNASGKFYNLLIATAQSPAMLLYLDNFNSAGMNSVSAEQQQKQQQRIEQLTKELMEDAADGEKKQLLEQMKNRKKNLGLNENYAREVMELHTLGVDGGYTQNDVTEAARVLTGWTVYPLDGLGPSKFARKLIDKFGEDNLVKRGYVHNGDFFFALNRHDDKEKTVLGKTFTAGGGYDEGVQLLMLLAHHPSTAAFISKKIATRFVSDAAPRSLVDKMAASFIKNDGDIKQVLITMVSSPEFWAREALREKTKSPFELVISTIRGLNAGIEQPFLLYQWVSKMGQQLYYYQAPTGFPDKGQYWINTGSLLNRMKFGLAFAAQKIPGVSFNLAALNHNREPESAMAALVTYSNILMPERNLDASIKRLEPMINDPSLLQKVDAAAEKNTGINNRSDNGNNDEMMETAGVKKMNERRREPMNKKDSGKEISPKEGNNTMLAQVVGVIIGSPEFQRR